MFRPFKCVLDIGIHRATTGARVFGALKGAVDGGLDVPHSVKRFPGYSKGDGKDAKDEYKAEVHADKIFGGHVRDYMQSLQEKDPAKYSKHFSQFVANNIEPDGLADLYSKVHAAIRKDPSAAPKKEALAKEKRKIRHSQRSSLQQKRANRLKKIQDMKQKAAAAAEKQPLTTENDVPKTEA